MPIQPASQSKPALSMIAAVARNGVIGDGNKLPWRLPADQAYFKQTTMGHSVIMGRKTFESIGKPLPGRKNIVLTRDRNFRADGCIAVHSPEEALRIAGEEPFVIGGTEVYNLFWPYADKLYITFIDESFEGDATFPEIDPGEWTLVSEQPGTLDERNRHPHSFRVYQRNACAETDC